jgi:hypothetical protein
MKAVARPDDWGRNLNIWLYEEDFGTQTTRVARFLGDNVVTMEPVPEGVQPNPTLILPRQLAQEMAEAILGKAGSMSDELLETLKVERARVDKLIDFAITPPTQIFTTVEGQR